MDWLWSLETPSDWDCSLYLICLHDPPQGLAVLEKGRKERHSLLLPNEQATKSRRHLENMLKPIYQPSDHCRNSLRNQECAHSGKVRGLLLCTFISILQVEVHEIGQKCPLPALRSQEPEPCQAWCPAQPERGCPSGPSYGCFRACPEPLLSPLMAVKKSRDSRDCQQMGTSLINYICSGVWSSPGRARCTQGPAHCQLMVTKGK